MLGTAADTAGKRIAEYIPNQINLDDSYATGMDESEDFLNAFANLPSDDMIEGVVVQVRTPDQLPSWRPPIFLSLAGSDFG